MGNESPHTSTTVETIPVVTSASSQMGTATKTAEQAAKENLAQSKRIQWMIIGGTLLVVAIIISAIVLMAYHPHATEIIRDIAIVFVAVETFVIGLAMILLIFQIQALIRVLQDEIEPLLHSVNDTASTVKGTTDFVSYNVVSPIIKLAGFTAAVQQVTRNVAGVIGGLRPQHQSNTKGGTEDVGSE